MEGVIVAGWVGFKKKDQQSFEGVNPKMYPSVIFPAKMGLFRNSRGLQFRTNQLWQNHRQVRRTKECSFIKEKGRVGRIVVSKKSLEGNWESQLLMAEL